MIKKILTILIVIFPNVINCFNANIKSMSFNLNKDSLWLSYPLKTTGYKKIISQLPKSHRLCKCKIFEEDNSDYRLFFNIFEVKTQFFKGDRLEIVTIAENIYDNSISFIILDCYSNVMTWDPIDGIQDANSKFIKKITNTKYNIKINKNKNKNRLFKLKSFKGKIQKTVLPSFSIYPNYICYFKNFTKGYKLKFNENQLNKKVLILKNVDLYHNIYTQYLKELEHAFIYPNKLDFKVLF